MDTGTDWLPFVLQVSDPLFPTGAYAHSLGLEEMVRLGVVKDEETLREFLCRQVLPAMGAFDLPYLRWAREAALRGDLDTLCELDREVDATKVCRELRDASEQLGVRRLLMLIKLESGPMLEQFERRRAAGDAAGHHVVVSGIQLREVPLDAALQVFAYQSLAGTCGAALKLIRIGQESCQRALRAALGTVGKTVEESKGVERGDAGWFNPLLEIASMRHETAHERLFIS